MHPILFQIGSFQLPAYGALLISAFLIATFFLRKEASRMGKPPEKVADVAIMGLLFGLLGAKLLLVLVDLPEYLRNPSHLLGTLRSAGVIYGGLLGGALGMIWFMRKHKLPLWGTFDLMAPFAALGVGLGRLGCLMAGCCHGIEYEGPGALVFPEHPLCSAPANVGLFPIQLVGLLNGILLCLGLVYLLRKHYRFQGQIIIIYMGAYGLTRGLMEFLRGDTVRGIWLGGTMSTSQMISLLGVVIAAWLYYTRSKSAREGALS